MLRTRWVIGSRPPCRSSPDGIWCLPFATGGSESSPVQRLSQPTPSHLALRDLGAWRVERTHPPVAKEATHGQCTVILSPPRSPAATWRAPARAGSSCTARPRRSSAQPASAAFGSHAPRIGSGQGAAYQRSPYSLSHSDRRPVPGYRDRRPLPAQGVVGGDALDWPITGRRHHGPAPRPRARVGSSSVQTCRLA
jgi:hypothetical protein